MNELITRRDAIGASLAIGAVSAFARPGTAAARLSPAAAGIDGHRHDWDWLVGRWNVRHRRLNGRLVGSTDWQEFDGTSHLWLTLDGLGTVDDNWLDLPGGAYRAVGLRAFDPATRRWGIWWLDARYPTRIDPPVYGAFENGVGTFVGDDVLDNRPIKVRFRWSEITATSARWEQAFSPDNGATWEVNWVMRFTRAAA